MVPVEVVMPFFFLFLCRQNSEFRCGEVSSLRGNSRTAGGVDWHSFPAKWKETLNFFDLRIDCTSVNQSDHCSDTYPGAGTSLVISKCLWNE